MTDFYLVLVVHPENGGKDISIPSSRTTLAWDFPIDEKKWQYLHYLLWKATQPLDDLGIAYKIACSKTHSGVITNSLFDDRKKFFKTYSMAVIGAEERAKEREQKKLERRVKTQIKNNVFDSLSKPREELIKELIQQYADPSFKIPDEALQKAAEHIVDSGFLDKLDSSNAHKSMGDGNSLG
jgi:hypothetical protein